jgi:hypothetical protein
MSFFGKKNKVAPAPPDAVEKKYILAAIDQLVKEGKSWKGSDGEEVVDGNEMTTLAQTLQTAAKAKTWKGGKTRRRRVRKTRRHH